MLGAAFGAKDLTQIQKGYRKSYLDFLQIVLDSRYEDGSTPSLADIRAEVDTFMVRSRAVRNR